LLPRFSFRKCNFCGLHSTISDLRLIFVAVMKCMHRSPVNARLSPQSTAVDKEQQEIHGFIFGEVNADASGKPLSSYQTKFMFPEFRPSCGVF
jgi:hypothetical protein